MITIKIILRITFLLLLIMWKSCWSPSALCNNNNSTSSRSSSSSSSNNNSYGSIDKHDELACFRRD